MRERSPPKPQTTPIHIPTEPTNPRLSPTAVWPSPARPHTRAFPLCGYPPLTCTIMEKCHLQCNTQRAKAVVTAASASASASARLCLCMPESDPLCQPCECSKNAIDPSPPRSSCPPCTVRPTFTPESLSCLRPGLTNVAGEIREKHGPSHS